MNIFQFKTVYDLTGATPQVKLTNQSSGPNMANISYWFVLTSPSGVVYHMGTQAAPDKNGIWNTEWTVPEPIPMIEQHIDWSGSDYKIVGYAKDSLNTVFETEAIPTRICRPTGNKQNQKNNWGGGSLAAFMNCISGKLLIEDKSSYSYNGITGQVISKLIKLFFPPDDTGVPPAPFEENNSNTAQVIIPYNGKNYQLLLDAVYEYDMGNNTFVRIKYKFKACFDINCGVELCSIMCAIGKYEEELETNGCSAQDREKLLLVLSKLVRVFGGLLQPQCGINVPKLIEEIRAITGDCGDCDKTSNGINPAGSCAVPVNLDVD